MPLYINWEGIIKRIMFYTFLEMFTLIYLVICGILIPLFEILWRIPRESILGVDSSRLPSF